MASAARSARENRAREFGIVTSGKAVADSEEVERIAEAIAEIAALGIHPCISPGLTDEAALQRWKEAGLTRYHHNLEAAPSFFPAVCSTHRIEEDIESLQAAKAAGLPVCAGGIFGMGESWAQRVELALLLKELQVDSVPLNFLDPIPGTPMAETAPGIGPWEALKTIALFRLMMPDRRIIICGGRMKALGERQAEMFAAGANGLMIGNYLTTLGRPPAADLEMLSGLGLEPASP
jgi:biotin synthase